MSAEEVRQRIAHMVVLVKASLDYSFMLKGELHREDKQIFNGFVGKAQGFVRFFMGDSLKDEYIDETLEEASEYYLEGTRLLLMAMDKGKSTDALEALRETIGS